MEVSIMARKRRVHSTEFKLEAIRLLEDGKLKISEVARDLDISPGLLRSWRKKYSELGKDAFPGHGNLSDVEAENRRLRRENAKLKQEREFLKKAATFFAKESE
jgi:transposase-like protein